MKLHLNSVQCNAIFLLQVLDRGDIVYIDDGLISVKVTEKTQNSLVTSKGINRVIKHNRHVILKVVFML